MRIEIESFIAGAQAARDSASLSMLFMEFAGQCGFEYLTYHHLVSNFRKIPFAEGVRLACWPTSFAQWYLEHGCFSYDPCVERARRVGVPFRLAEVLSDPHLTKMQFEMIERARNEGIATGLGVPVFARQGDAAYIGLASSDATLFVSDAEALAIQAVCQHFHVKYGELVGGAVETPLSRREIEVLELIASGKSNARIAQSLKISENTVDTHVRRCFEKLGVGTRVEAVLSGISTGLILP